MKKKSWKPGKRFRIYLAGPIHGCNERQRSYWRRRLRDNWGDRFEFIDPTEEIVSAADQPDLGAYEIIERDQRAIRECDAVLANMWKESIGTAMGIVHAKREGKLVAVVDPNHIGNRILAFYADVVSDREDGAMRHLKTLLEQEQEIRMVVKRSGKPPEPFRRDKLVTSIRHACQTAGRDDVLVPLQVVPRVLELMLEGGRVISGQVTTTEIRNAVWEVLADLEADPLWGEEFAGVRSAWEDFDQRTKPRAVPASPIAVGPELRIAESSLHILIESHKSHSTIWGKNIHAVDELPSPARDIFQEIARVEGIAMIRFGPFTSAGPHDVHCRVEIIASKIPGFIEGKCYDNGVKGNLQTFQIKVLDPFRTEAVRQALIRHLGGKMMLRYRE